MQLRLAVKEADKIILPQVEKEFGAIDEYGDTTNALNEQTVESREESLQALIVRLEEKLKISEKEKLILIKQIEKYKEMFNEDSKSFTTPKESLTYKSLYECVNKLKIELNKREKEILYLQVNSKKMDEKLKLFEKLLH